MLEPRIESTLGRILLELLLLCSLCSFGLSGLRPDWRANRFKISVREITPVRRPEIRAPGNAAAETAGNEEERFGDPGVDTAGDERIALDIEEEVDIEGVTRGVAERDGEAASTIHILCERVATSLATVCARVEKGFTWKTGRVSAELNLSNVTAYLGTSPFRLLFLSR